jgi:prepilin-type N-terminal cleavage/methylation domain-containing protein
MTQDSQKGFTLIELLVVVAIIGLLTSMIAVGYGNARLKSRDAKRLSDIQQVKTGLDLYYTSHGGYPDSLVWNAGAVQCDASRRYMEVPRDPAFGTYYAYTPRNNSSITACGGSALWRDYKVEFATEGPTDLGDAGTYYLSPAGLTSVAPF